MFLDHSHLLKGSSHGFHDVFLSQSSQLLYHLFLHYVIFHLWNVNFYDAIEYIFDFKAVVKILKQLVIKLMLFFVRLNNALRHQLVVGFEDSCAEQLNDGHSILESQPRNLHSELHDGVLHVTNSHHLQLVFQPHLALD